jgi:hypothetical protein
MSKEAEEFFKQKTIENAETPRMKKFLALVNREAEGKILQEYAEQQLILHGLAEAFYCWNEDCNMEKCNNICISCEKYKGNGVKQ